METKMHFLHSLIIIKAGTLMSCLTFGLFIGQLLIQDCSSVSSDLTCAKLYITEHTAATNPPVLVPLVFLERER